MAPRLLTLLALIETSLAKHGSRAVASPPSRSVNFHKGLARITFVDGSGSILLQNFTLADEQICVRAVFSWAGSTATGSHSIYPSESFDWSDAGGQIAAAWLAGQTAAAVPMPQAPVDTTAAPLVEPVAAAG